MTNCTKHWLIVGLGNPGEDYDGTRHNAGFCATDALAQTIKANYWKQECGALTSEKEYEGHVITLAKPQSYMNLSGSPVSLLVRKKEIELSNLIVIHDDLDLPCGTIRVKDGGGHGGHNGMRSIIDKLNTNNFTRVKIGIGRPLGRTPIVDYVLKKPLHTEIEDFNEACVRAAEAALYVLENGIPNAQAKYN